MQTTTETIAGRKWRRGLATLMSTPEGSFWAYLALGVDQGPDDQCDTAWTDGTQIRYCPEFIAGLSIPQVAWVIAHEVGHICLRHCTRRRGRDPKTWNIAADLAIWCLTQRLGSPLDIGHTPAGHNLPDDWSADQYYSALAKAGGGSDQADSQGNQPPMGGDVRDTPVSQGDGSGSGDGGDTPGAQPGQLPTAAEVEAAISQAVATAASEAKARGLGPTTPTGQFIESLRRQPANWRQALRSYCRDRIRARPKWRSPNRRHQWRGVILPGRSRERHMKRLLVAIDSSASMGTAEIAACLGELEEIARAYRQTRLELVWWDTSIHPAESADDRQVRGRGCTDIACVVQYLDDHAGDYTACAILTDGAFGAVPDRVAMPCLWAYCGPERWHQPIPGHLGRQITIN